MKKFLRQARRVRDLIVLGTFFWKVAKWIYDVVTSTVIWSSWDVRKLRTQISDSRSLRFCPD
jgi:hypothetical protein